MRPWYYLQRRISAGANVQRIGTGSPHANGSVKEASDCQTGGRAPLGGRGEMSEGAWEAGRDAKVYFHWIRVCCVTSAMPAELTSFTFALKVCVLTSSRSTALLICSVQAPAVQGTPEHIWRMPEHDAAIQLNFAPSRQEVKCRNNNITSSYFSK